MIIKLANNKEYTACTTADKVTAVIPSGSSTSRSKMDIYLPIETMELSAFIEEFSKEENLEAITFKDATFENVYTNFVVVSSIGKEFITIVDNETGAVVEEYRLAAHLEQLTYIEQKLKELGL